MVKGEAQVCEVWIRSLSTKMRRLRPGQYIFPAVGHPFYTAEDLMDARVPEGFWEAAVGNDCEHVLRSFSKRLRLTCDSARFEAQFGFSVGSR